MLTALGLGICGQDHLLPHSMKVPLPASCPSWGVPIWWLSCEGEAVRSRLQSSPISHRGCGHSAVLLNYSLHITWLVSHPYTFQQCWAQVHSLKNIINLIRPAKRFLRGHLSENPICNIDHGLISSTHLLVWEGTLSRSIRSQVQTPCESLISHEEKPYSRNKDRNLMHRRWVLEPSPLARGHTSLGENHLLHMQRPGGTYEVLRNIEKMSVISASKNYAHLKMQKNWGKKP